MDKGLIKERNFTQMPSPYLGPHMPPSQTSFKVADLNLLSVNSDQFSHSYSTADVICLWCLFCPPCFIDVSPKLPHMLVYAAAPSVCVCVCVLQQKLLVGD